ncbi:MAG: hypothetical protein KTR35_02815 [Gammaproteobacteria bacterium]|nr:hypothetical protein [Gammaproteobacteria bacterium]
MRTTGRCIADTGITGFLRNGGELEKAARIAGNDSTRTSQLYDRMLNPTNRHGNEQMLR